MSADSGVVGNMQVAAKDRVIFALDVPTASEALDIANELGERISFYKVGLELLMSGGVEELLRELLPDKKVFLDFKLPSDIPTTVERAVSSAARLGVTFLTLSNSVTTQTIQAAVKGRGSHEYPKLLYVSFLSSLDRADFSEQFELPESKFEEVLQSRTERALAAGADGLIVSGQEIGLLRKRHPAALLVSPGIRPSWSSADDHKRSCTPAEARRLGADFLVIGRPIRDAENRGAAAERVIRELEARS